MISHPENTPFATVAGRIAPGATLRRRWPLEGGVSAHVDAMELAHPDGHLERLVIRQHGATDWKSLESGVTSTEFALLTVLHERGFAVPAPRLLDISCTVLPAPYMVMAFIDGSTDVAPEALPDALRQMEDYLTRLHALELGALELPALPRREDPMENILRYLPESPLGGRIHAALTEHGPVRVTNPPVLLHGDFWPGNILWRDGRIAAVLDWEDAAIGDPAADLAGSRLELLWKYGLHAMETFTAFYLSSMPIDLTTLPFWEISGATGASALMGKWGLEPEVEAGMRARAAWLIEDALARLEAQQG